MTRTAALLTVSALLAGEPSWAEEPPEVAAGTRVRVRTSGTGGFAGTFEGTIARLTVDELTMVDTGRGTVMTIPTSSVTRLQVSSGKRQRLVKRMLVGALWGAAIGAVLGGVDTGDGCSLDLNTYEPCTLSTAAHWAALTAVTGAATGAAFAVLKPAETWSDRGLAGLKIGLAPTRGGGRVDVSLAF